MENIKHILTFRELLYQRDMLLTMIYVLPEGTQVEFSSSGNIISLPNGLRIESVYGKFGITPRMITAQAGIPTWNSDLHDIGIANLSKGLGKGSTNLQNLKEETTEVYRAYHSMRDYPKVFAESYGVNLDHFFDVITELSNMCYYNTHTVGAWSLSDLLNEEKLTKKFNTATIKSVIQLLSDQTKSKDRYDGLIDVGNDAFTSFSRLHKAQLAILEKCFCDIYENNLKGKVFEEACRELLRKNGFNTIPERVDVFEPMLPYDVACSLWGKQKNRTDIDVISSRKNCILVVECKEIKSYPLAAREKRQFAKFFYEHYFRTKWIVSDLKRFKRYLGVAQWDSLNIDERYPICFFPLLVTNYLVEIERIENAPLITYIEMKKITSRDWFVDGNNETGTLETDIEGRKINLLWLSSRLNVC